MYVERHADATLRMLAGMFGAVLVTGPRQVGKTTLFQKVANHAAYVTLDDPLLLASALERCSTGLMSGPTSSGMCAS